MRRLSLLLLIFCTFSAVFSQGRKVVYEEIDWQILSGEHFDIYYPEGYEQLAKTAMIYAEEANILISEKLSHNLSQVIPVFIYPSPSHFRGTNIIWGTIGEGVGGFTESVKKRVAVPFMGSYDDFRHVITHEMVHAFQYDILMGGGFTGLLASQYSRPPPLWLVEGMAEYFSQGWDESADMMMRDAILTDTLPTIQMMTEYRVLNGFIFYKGGQAVMRFIDETWGVHKIGEILRDMRDLKGIDEAIRANLGISMKEFDEKWRLWAKRRYYPLIEKEMGDEAGRLLTKHLENRSFLNMHPAISPDGKRTAYITIRNRLPAVVIRDIPSLEKKPDYRLNRPVEDDFTDEEELLIQGGDNNTFYQLHLLDNRLSFSPDGKKLFLVVHSGGKDRLILFDIEEKEIAEEFVPAADMIQYPRLSYDGTKAVYSATINGQSDIYLLDLRTRSVEKLTDDLYHERDPALSGDNRYVTFSSNKTPAGNFETENYNIHRLEIESGRTERLTSATGKQINPVFYNRENNNRILYVSNETGIHNAYLVDTGSEPVMVTDIQGGVFEPATDSANRRMVFAHYRKQGYDITVREAPQNADDVITDPETVHEYQPLLYPVYPGSLADSRIEPYGLQVTPDWLFFGFQYSSFYGFGGFLQYALSDYTGNHQISGYVDFLSERDALNFNVAYGYLKKRMNFYFGAFRASNYFSIFNLANLATINDFLYYPGFIASSIRYGAYARAEYPLSPFLSVSGQLEFSRYEETYFRDVEEPFRRLDIYTNMNSFSLMLNYNNVLYSYSTPVQGMTFQYQSEQLVDLSGNDYVFHRESFDFRTYYTFAERYTLAMRLTGGSISGPEKEFFPWQAGGFNTLRGFDFLSLTGSNLFIANFEIRYPLVDAIAFGFPAPWVIRGFSGVFFVDMGAVYDNPDHFRGYNSETGRLEDFKLSYGLGTRFVFFPGLLFKIDWATPWDFQSSLPISKWRGIFSIGYQF